jgi:exopolysaccharide production protein ExoZ
VIFPIQYLRALAAGTVVWLHALYVIPGVADRFGAPFLGSSGVDLFFVISGFIMVVTTARMDVTPASFLCLRIIRVVPLYWLATLAMVALEASDSGAYRDTPGAMVKSLLFVPYSAPESPRGTPIVEIGWTLNYEMFFYVLFALSLAAPRRLRLPGMVLTLGMPALIGRLFGPFGNPMAVVYTSPLLLEFLAGMMVAHAWLRDGSRHWLPLPLPLLALLLVFGVYCLGAAHSRWVVMGGAFIIVAACLHPRIRSIRTRSLLELGNASYAIYLVHQFVLDALAPRWIRLVPRTTRASSALFMLAAMTLCVTAGWLCYRLIERPLTSYLRTRVRKYAPVPESSRST